MILLLFATAYAAPPPADPALARLSWSLRQAAEARDGAALETFRHRRRAPLAADGLSVVLEPEGGDVDAVAAAATAAGFRVEVVAGGAVQVWAPYGRLRELGLLPGIGRVREPWVGSPRAVVSEGYDAVMRTDWHDEGVTGADVTIGVIDVGFTGWESLGSDEFPVDAQANLEYQGDSDASHGAEVTEVLYDFAPDATYILGAFQTDVQFCNVLQSMAEAGADVVNASVGFDDVWATDASSGLTQCVDQVVDDGVQVFVAAGNERERYRSGELSYADADGTIALAGESLIWMDSDQGYVDVRLRWDEPFGEARQDIDLKVYNRDGSLCGLSADYQGGWGDPYENVVASGCKGRVYAVISSAGQAADLSGLRGWLYSASGLDAEFQLGEGSISLPGDTQYGITVGAWSLSEDDVASYSSQGPTQDGRTKPDVVAPSDVSTRTTGRDAFSGTSAATPHAAGLGALWVSATGGHGASEELKTWMLDGAEDVGDPGVDERSGHGLIQADALPEPIRRCGCAVPARGGLLGVGLTMLLAWTRRR